MKNFCLIKLEKYDDASQYEKAEDGFYRKLGGSKSYVTAFSFEYEDRDKGLEETIVTELAQKFNSTMSVIQNNHPAGIIEVSSSEYFYSSLKELNEIKCIYLDNPSQLWGFDGEDCGIKYELFIVEKEEVLVKRGNEEFDSENYGEAFDCYMKAVIQGYEDAEMMYRLGLCYNIGPNYVQDKAKAAEWLRKAAAAGHSKAKEMLEKEAAVFEAAEKAAAQKAAIEKESGEKANEAWGLKRKGDDAYQRKEYEESFSLYSKAALLGDDDALKSLVFYWEEKKESGALHWLTETAEQGNAGAQNKLGLYYANGTGVEQDFQKAAYWYTKAAEQGDTLAQKRLSYLKSDGKI